MSTPQGSDKEIRERIQRLVKQDVTIISENQVIQGHLRSVNNDVLTLDDFHRVVVKNGDRQIQPHRWYVRVSALAGIGHRISNEIEIPAMPMRADVDPVVVPPPPEKMEKGWALISGEDQWHCIDLMRVVDEAETLCSKKVVKVLTLQRDVPRDGDVCQACESKNK